MRLHVLVGLVLLTGAESVQTQETTGGIRGAVLTLGEQPVVDAEVQVRPSQGQEAIGFANTASDGSFQIGNLPPDTYTMKISAPGFYSAEIREVPLSVPELKAIPAVRLDVGLIADCGLARRPDYYRLSAGGTGTGAIGGVVMNDKKAVVDRASVKLFMQGRGQLSSQLTKDDGTFSFAGLQVRPGEYWVLVTREGYFVEELQRLVVLPGLEAVYSPITLESCDLGRCQPHLKTVRVIHGCA